MTTEIVRVGNTLTVEIPEELVAQSSLPIGEPVDWIVNGDGSITLLKRPKTPVAPSITKPINDMTLEELLEGVEDGTSLAEYDWGKPRGAEVW